MMMVVDLRLICFKFFRDLIVAAHVVFDLNLFTITGQIIATSHDLTPNGGLVREIFYFRET